MPERDEFAAGGAPRLRRRLTVDVGSATTAVACSVNPSEPESLHAPPRSHVRGRRPAPLLGRGSRRGRRRAARCRRRHRRRRRRRPRQPTRPTRPAAGSSSTRAARTPRRRRDFGPRRGGFHADRTFTHGIHGFSARLTGAQVDALRRDSAVAQVVPDERIQVEGQINPDRDQPDRCSRVEGGEDRRDRRPGRRRRRDRRHRHRQGPGPERRRRPRLLDLDADPLARRLRPRDACRGHRRGDRQRLRRRRRRAGRPALGRQGHRRHRLRAAVAGTPAGSTGSTPSATRSTRASR